MLLLWLASCRPDPAPPVAEDRARDTAPDSAPAVCADDWARFGQPLMLTWCAPCHSSRLEEAQRYGAPVGVDLETLAGVHTWSARIAARVQEGTMPPGGGMDEADVARLVAWLGCGAAGEEAPLPEVVGELARYEGWELDERAADPEVEGATLAVVTAPVLWGGQPWSVEHWDQDSTPAALVGRDRYDEDGQLVYADRWDPPLPLWDPAGGTWTVLSTRTRSGEGAAVAEEAWTVTVSEHTLNDPRLLSDTVLWVEAGTPEGDSIGLMVDPALGYVLRWYGGGRFTDPGVDWVELSNSGGGEAPVGSGLPFWEVSGWGARMITVEY